MLHNAQTLREELRKVQSSAALLERQRNPGVGYWAAKPDGSTETRSPTSSVSDLPQDSSPRPSSPSTGKSDEEVNYEYLRNVIMQFLEHKEMRVSPVARYCASALANMTRAAPPRTHPVYDSKIHAAGDQAIGFQSLTTCASTYGYCLLGYVYIFLLMTIILRRVTQPSVDKLLQLPYAESARRVVAWSEVVAKPVRLPLSGHSEA